MDTPRILQSHLVGGSDTSHVDWLLSMIRLPDGGVLLDMGCGYGEVPRLMAARRPDMKFILVNNNADQLAEAPRGDAFQWEFAGAERTPVASGSVDVVLFAYSFGFVNQEAALREARRVLKAGGDLVFYEPAGAVEEFKALFGYTTFPFQPEFEGFRLTQWSEPEASTEHVASWLGSLGELPVYEASFARCRPILAVYTKQGALQPTVPEVFARHERIALNLSGGKDSTACLYLLRDYWDRVDVYWLNTGDTLPETTAIMDAVRQMVPNFIEVKTDVLAWRKVHGMPSDLVPTNSSHMGRFLGFGSLKVTDRFRCCQENMMDPLYRRMLADGVTCIVRGQKTCDMPNTPHLSGEVSVEGIEVFYPIESWSHQDVLDFLRDAGALTHPCYEGGNHIGVDCAHCTGWWHESHFDFLQKRHPVIWMEVKKDLSALQNALVAHMSHFPKED